MNEPTFLERLRGVFSEIPADRDRVSRHKKGHSQPIDARKKRRLKRKLARQARKITRRRE